MSSKRNRTSFRRSPRLGSAAAIVGFATIFVVAVLVSGASNISQAINGRTAFNYTANLLNGGARVTDTCDFQFSLYTDKFGGQKIGDTLHQALAVVDSVYTARLNFGHPSSEIAGFYLDVIVHCPSATDQPAKLVRQRLSAKKPYDIRGLTDLATAKLGDFIAYEEEYWLPNTVSGLPGSRLSDHRPWSLGYYQDTDGDEYAAFGVITPRRAGKGAETAQGKDGAKRAGAASVNGERPTPTPQPEATPGQRRESGAKGHNIGGGATGNRSSP